MAIAVTKTVTLELDQLRALGKSGRAAALSAPLSQQRLPGATLPAREETALARQRIAIEALREETVTKPVYHEGTNLL